MALADYRLCDVCGSKTFYDARLNYEQTVDGDGALRNGGEMMQGLSLDYLGDWCVLCTNCARTHRCVIVSLDAAKGEPS